ncbi:MAG TPA: trypsin-like serine protease [Vicinamibacterales bacterium]|nr:trypsin-like serine protease [Vicinamibacterales bacterium]
MRLRIGLALCASACLAMVWPANAITNGQPDGNGHPYVGTVIQFIPNTDLISICSGSALSATRFLTAAHCADPALPVFVTYKNAPPYSLANDFVQGTFFVDPNWCPGCGPGLKGADSHDEAVVALSKAVDPGGFAALPAAGLVDTLPMNLPIDLVGYGVQGFVHGGGKPQQLFLFTRYVAATLLVQSNDSLADQQIKLTANPSQSKGGICFGDSGGPDLIAGTRTIIGINSFVLNNSCSGITYSQRIDKADILAFITGV